MLVGRMIRLRFFCGDSTLIDNPPAKRQSLNQDARCGSLATARPGQFGSVLTPSTAVTRGLDPRVHLLRIKFVRRRWIAGSSPAMTGEIVAPRCCTHSIGTCSSGIARTVAPQMNSGEGKDCLER